MTQECEAQKESIKQLETSLARVQKLVVSKSDEVAQLSARSSALEDSLRALGSALLTQVRPCADKLAFCLLSGRLVPASLSPCTLAENAGGGIVGPTALARQDSTRRLQGLVRPRPSSPTGAVHAPLAFRHIHLHTCNVL